MALGHPIVFQSMMPLATTLQVKNLISICRNMALRDVAPGFITSHVNKLHQRQFNRYIHQLFTYARTCMCVYTYMCICVCVYARVLLLAFDCNRYIQCIASHYITFQRIRVHCTTTHARTLLCTTVSMCTMHLPAHASIRIQVKYVTRMCFKKRIF